MLTGRKGVNAVKAARYDDARTQRRGPDRSIESLDSGVTGRALHVYSDRPMHQR